MTVRLALGPGEGLVVRLDDELLFLQEPRRDSRLSEAFVGAQPGARIDAVIELLEMGEEPISPMVMVGWIGRTRLVVGGEIDISVDQSRLAALSKPGVRQWLERSIASDAAVNLGVGAAATLPESELIAGAVPAGSIQLSLNERPPLALLEAQSQSERDKPESNEFTGGTLTWESDFDDPLDDPDQPTFMPQRVSGLTPMGRIRFDDGAIERLNQPIVIGRSPNPHEIPAEARAVSWDVPSVSRLHLEIRPKGDGAEIVDLGSKNGTFVVNLSATGLVALEPHVPSLISAGIQVLLGERHFVFEVVTS